MPIVEYDIIGSKIDKTKTWIDNSRKTIISRECIHNYKNYAIATKYNSNTEEYNFYIIHSKVTKQGLKPCKLDDFGRFKFSISNIWNNLNFDVNSEDVNINFPLVEQTEDCDIYKIDV